MELNKKKLRVTSPCCELSKSTFPRKIGSNLKHPYIVTDCFEAMYEFVTPVCTDISQTLQYLKESSQFVANNIDNDIFWANSMPTRVENWDSVLLGFSEHESNLGKMKHAYRKGVFKRYGQMQILCGLHYNFSLPVEFWEQQGINVSDGYFSLVRNFHRYYWLLIYLFGASPACDKSFLTDHQISQLEMLSNDTFFLPFATSLRVSDLLGYSNRGLININHNELQRYISDIAKLVGTSCKDYEAFGLKTPSGEYQQLSTNFLQIENEYYSAIRPKRVIRGGQSQLEALRYQGVEYVEVRCLDLNPFQPLGIDKKTSHFIDAFLVFCALLESPFIGEEENKLIAVNVNKTAIQGRKPGLLLDMMKHDTKSLKSIPLQEYGLLLISGIYQVAKMLDEANDTKIYSNSVDLAQEKLLQPCLTVSSQILKKIEQHGNCFFYCQ